MDINKLFISITFVFVVIILNQTYTYHTEYNEKKSENLKSLIAQRDEVTRLEKKYDRKDKKSKEALKKKEKNNLDQELVKNRIEESLKEINVFNGFHAKLEGIKEHKKFVNVVLAKIKLSFNLSNFDISDFEKEFKNQFKPYSMVMPFKYKNEKEAMIYLIILKEKFENENNK